MNFTDKLSGDEIKIKKYTKKILRIVLTGGAVIERDWTDMPILPAGFLTPADDPNTYGKAVMLICNGGFTDVENMGATCYAHFGPAQIFHVSIRFVE